jgi:glycosyltransferase involved in cell wall biosynthesis
VIAAASRQNRPMDDRLRVAITLEQCWHRVPGGTAASIVELGRALAARAELEMVGVSAKHRSLPAAPFVPPIDVRALPLPRAALYETWHGLGWPSIEQATGPVDVVHATAVAIPPTRAPLVVTIHDLAFLDSPDQATRHGHRFFRRGLELARRRAAFVLCPSEATLAACLGAGFEADRLRLVPWGIRAVEVDAEAVDRARRAHHLTRPYVLFVGTAEPRKNLRALVDGFRGLGERELDLVLVGPPGWNEDLDARLVPLGPRARRLGFLGQADLAALYAGCAVFCYPSLQEGFGLPVLEAMAQGAPVVTSAGTATEEVAGDAALLIDPHAPSSVTCALARVLDDPDLAADLRRRGHARAATYTWERSAELTAAAYREAAQLAPARSRRNSCEMAQPLRRERHSVAARVGVNLLWLVPGVVGGSEEYMTRLLAGLAEHPAADLHLTLFVLEPFATAHPDLVAAFPTVTVGLDGARKAVRIMAESTWLPRRARLRCMDLMHHAGGVIPPRGPTPAILTIHDLQPLALPANFSLVKRTYLAAMLPRSAKAARLVVTPSDHAGREVVELLGVAPERVRTVPHGIAPVGPPPTAEQRASVRAVHRLDPEQFFFLYPAIAYPHKNHALLVDAFDRVAKKHSDVTLVFTGGAGREDGSLAERIVARGLTDRVRLLGRIPRFDLDVLLHEATALTFPSLYEGFGAPVLEAMARGCPVIAADATALPEVVGAAGVLADPRDPDAWARAMTSMICDDARRASFRAAGLERAATFTWDRAADALSGAYRQALA